MRPAAGAALAALLLLGLACEAVEEEVASQATPTPAPSAAPSPSVEPTIAPTATVIPVTGWATFTNTAYGYSIDYPANWLVNPYQPGTDPSSSNYVAFYNRLPSGTGGGPPPADEIKIEIVVLDNPDALALAQWVDEHLAQGPDKATIKSRTDVVVNGVAGIQQLSSVGAFEFYTAYFASGVRIYIINGPQSNSLFLETYNRLLSSFRLNP